MEQQLAELRAERSAELRAQMQSAQLRTAELQKDRVGIGEVFPLSLCKYCVCIYIYINQSNIKIEIEKKYAI
jgi:hypothetical protein